jgi:hypothetical protein
MTKLYFITQLALISLGFTLYAQERGILKNNDLPNNIANHLPDGSAISETYDTAYCYIAFDQPNNRSGPAKFALSDPGNILLLANQSGMNYLDGGTWGYDKKWFGTVSIENTLITIDPRTGGRVLSGSLGMPFSGISFDYTSNTMFGVAWDGFASSLYSINTTNGTPTLIGQSEIDILVNLACDASGNLYSVGLASDYLYKLNKVTGAATAIGPVGIDLNYQQDMEFDLNTGILYMAAYNSNASSGEFRTVNKTTGASTLIGKFQGGAEITGFCIPNNAINVSIEVPLKTESPVKIFPNPGNGIFSVKTDLQLATFEITDALGKLIYSAQIAAGTTEINISKQSKGIYYYLVKNGNRSFNAGKICIE